MYLGISSNTSSIQTHTVDQIINPSDDTEYRVWKAVVHTGTHDPTTASNSDGQYDEGVRKIYLEFSGAGQSSANGEVVFNASNGIDKLESDDKAEVNLDSLVATSDQPLTAEVEVVTFATGTELLQLTETSSFPTVRALLTPALRRQWSRNQQGSGHSLTA
ncbi:hypothetical protein [Haloarcula pellucida]|nr:hypothetical protein [Halomicroarcula pellucida]MBX0347930.1 hypothetical protein [Halomicroarcula pellucida]